MSTGETRLEVYAATGAISIPPTIKGRVICHRKFWKPKVRPKVRTMAVVTKNSATLTEPIMYLGVVWLLVTKVAVATGARHPHQWRPECLRQSLKAEATSSRTGQHGISLSYAVEI